MVKENVRVWDETTSKKDLYKMTHSNTSVPIKELADGHVINPINFVEFVDVNSKGEENYVLAIMDADGTIYNTISNTFKNEFYDMVNSFELEFECVKLSGKTKAGRDFITCQLA